MLILIITEDIWLTINKRRHEARPFHKYFLVIYYFSCRNENSWCNPLPRWIILEHCFHDNRIFNTEKNEKQLSKPKESILFPTFWWFSPFLWNWYQINANLARNWEYPIIVVWNGIMYLFPCTKIQYVFSTFTTL